MQRGRLGGQVSLRGAGRILVAVLLALMPFTISWGQLTGGTISGAVSDSSGAVIPGATVTVRNLAAGRITDVATTGRQIQFALKLLF